MLHLSINKPVRLQSHSVWLGFKHNTKWKDIQLLLDWNLKYGQWILWWLPFFKNQWVMYNLDFTGHTLPAKSKKELQTVILTFLLHHLKTWRKNLNQRPSRNDKPDAQESSFPWTPVFPSTPQNIRWCFNSGAALTCINIRQKMWMCQMIGCLV